jgi:hypothetical protein
MSRTSHRRDLLRGFAGASALVPLLHARAGRAAPRFPRRLVIVHWTNGVLPDYWPQKPAPGQDFALSDTLSPLQTHKKDILLLGGLRIDCPDSTGHQTLPFLLTGAPAIHGRDEGGLLVGNAISVDQHVAGRLAQHAPTRFRSLELGAAYLDPRASYRALSFRGPAVDGRPADNPPEVDATRVWRRLFDDGAAGPGGSAALAQRLTRLRVQRRSVLDHVGRELAALGKRIGATDRAKLDAHLESLRQIEQELPGKASDLSTTPSLCAPVAPAGLGGAAGARPIDQLVAQQFDLLAMALRCDLVRVVTVLLVSAHNFWIRFPFLGPRFAGPDEAGVDPFHHAIAHHRGSRKAVIDKWWIGQFGALIERLKMVPEGDGTLLDNTTILFANQMGHGESHAVSGVPWILAGGCQGYFKTGRYLTPPAWDPARPESGCPPTNGVLTALANAMLAGWEDPLDHFGNPELTGELPGLRG